MATQRTAEPSPNVIGWLCEPIAPPTTPEDTAVRIVSRNTLSAIFRTAFTDPQDRVLPGRPHTDSELFGTPPADDTYKWTPIECRSRMRDREIAATHDRLLTGMSEYCGNMPDTYQALGATLAAGAHIHDAAAHLYASVMHNPNGNTPYMPPDRRTHTYTS